MKTKLRHIENILRNNQPFHADKQPSQKSLFENHTENKVKVSIKF